MWPLTKVKGKMGFRPRLIGAIFMPQIEGVMSIQIGEYEYEADLLEAAATAREYQEARKEVEREIANTTDEKQRHALAYGNWMRSRRSGDFEYFAFSQKQEIHEVAQIVNDRIVCTCGLKTTITDQDDEVGFWNEPGHIYTPTQKPVTLFVIGLYVSKAIGRQEHYWCQNCGDVGATIPTRAGNVSAVGLRAIRSSHRCSVDRS